MDFRDTEKVLNNRRIREDYLQQSEKTQIKINEMTAEEKAKQEIANVVVDMRNQDKVIARSKMSADEVATLEVRNIKRYQNPVGPNAEWLFKDKQRKLKINEVELSDDEIWNAIIEHSMKKDDVANTLLGIKHK